MEESLMLRIARDTKIKPYEGEINKEYLGRLVYSAMGKWLKVITLDVGNEFYIVRKKSKKYIFLRGTEILNNLILAIPECKDWFWSSYNESQDKAMHPIRVLRDRMLNSGELVEVDFKNSIATAKEYTLPVIGELERIIGLGNINNVNEYHVGVTRVKRGHMDKGNENVILSSFEFLEWLKKTERWEIINDLSNYEFFDPLSKYSPYKSWKNIFPNIESNGVALGRIKLFNDSYEYYLFKKKDDLIYSHKLSMVLNEFKEERRIILALRKISGNVMKAKLETKNNVVILKLFCRLPLLEERIFETYCWPKQYINDKLNYIIPSELWGYFKTILERLQIEVKE